MCRWRARQRGVAAIFAAIAASACLIAVALVLDIGRLFSAQRDLQRLAERMLPLANALSATS